MKRQYRRNIAFALSTTLGLALTSGFGASHAFAQSSMSRTQDKMSGMMANGDPMMTDDELDSEPVAIDFPLGAPDSGILYHWTNYGRTGMLKEGSASDAYAMQKLQRDARLAHQLKPTYPYTNPMLTGANGMYGPAMSTDSMMSHGMKMMTMDELESDPIKVAFPEAGPDTGILYHYPTYQRTQQMVEGSVAEIRQEQKLEKDTLREQLLKPTYPYPAGTFNGLNPEVMQGAAVSETDAMQMNPDVDPLPVPYPYAAPGSLHLYHYTDYSRTGMMVEGSASETRTKKKLMKDQNMKGGTSR